LESDLAGFAETAFFPVAVLDPIDPIVGMSALESSERSVETTAAAAAAALSTCGDFTVVRLFVLLEVVLLR
jgi:hypothetical protein